MTCFSELAMQACSMRRARCAVFGAKACRKPLLVAQEPAGAPSSKLHRRAHWSRPGAAQVGTLAVTELLLQNGAALDCCDSEGRTPLAYCLLFGDTQAAELLLSRGASPP